MMQCDPLAELDKGGNGYDLLLFMPLSAYQSGHIQVRCYFNKLIPVQSSFFLCYNLHHMCLLSCPVLKINRILLAFLHSTNMTLNEAPLN